MKKYASIFNLLLSVIILLLLSGCKKNVTENPLSDSKQRSLPGVLTIPDVYVAGSEGGQAKYWKNNVGVTLSGGMTANGIVIDGTDVYVCGYASDPTTFNLVAVYWKNGVLTTLSDGTDNAMATGIAVSGTDVYVSGRIGIFAGTAVYWKNGVEISLGWGEPNGVFAAANGDIYIANGEWGSPSYWKNGTLVNLTGASNGNVRAVAVNGSDVHVVGTQSAGATENALYWKNGVLQYLLKPSKTAAMAVAVNSLGHAIISGTSGTNLNNMHISYWDGIGDLNVLATGQFVAASTGIAVDLLTDDIYVCGSEFNSQSSPPARAKYWTISSTGGTTSVDLSSGPGDAIALAIALGY